MNTVPDKCPFCQSSVMIREVQQLYDRIKRMEEAGDELLEWLKDDAISDSNYRLLANAWQRAKDNKQ